MKRGALQKGTITYEGQRFLAGEDGALYVQAFVEGEDGVTYYGEDGAAVVGWFETAQDAETTPRAAIIRMTRLTFWPWALCRWATRCTILTPPAACTPRRAM